MSCIIHLDNYQRECHPGAQIKGKVVCSFSESEDIREIRVKLIGREDTLWTRTESHYDSRTKKTRKRKVTYIGDNDFLHSTTSLVGSGEIGPGRFEYPFCLVLPKKLPSSYDGKFGRIHYLVKATVDIPFAFDYEDEKSFRVVALIDFNTMIDDLNLEPVSYSDDKMICCWFCASGPITMNVHMEKEAYVPGESAKVKVEITNMSNESIETLEVNMKMTVRYKATCPKTDYKYDHELLASHHDSGVGAHGERTYVFELEIPESTPVPNFDLCTLFNQWTDITVEAVIPGCHQNLEISPRIVMGNISVRVQGQIQNTNNQHSAIPQNNQFPTGGVPYSTPPPYSLSTNSPPVAFPSLPPGALPPLPPPATPGSSIPSGPSAPLPEDTASAPPKAELAEEEGFTIVNGPNSATGGETSDTNELLSPPSYNEAVSLPPYIPK